MVFYICIKVTGPGFSEPEAAGKSDYPYLIRTTQGQEDDTNEKEAGFL